MDKVSKGQLTPITRASVGEQTDLRATLGAELTQFLEDMHRRDTKIGRFSDGGYDLGPMTLNIDLAKWGETISPETLKEGIERFELRKSAPHEKFRLELKDGDPTELIRPPLEEIQLPKFLRTSDVRREEPLEFVAPPRVTSAKSGRVEGLAEPSTKIELSWTEGGKDKSVTVLADRNGRFSADVPQGKDVSLVAISPFNRDPDRARSTASTIKT